jgi:hypothetical protein
MNPVEPARRCQLPDGRVAAAIRLAEAGRHEEAERVLTELDDVMMPGRRINGAPPYRVLPPSPDSGAAHSVAGSPRSIVHQPAQARMVLRHAALRSDERGCVPALRSWSPLCGYDCG